MQLVKSSDRVGVVGEKVGLRVVGAFVVSAYAAVAGVFVGALVGVKHLHVFTFGTKPPLIEENGSGSDIAVHVVPG